MPILDDLRPSWGAVTTRGMYAAPPATRSEFMLHYHDATPLGLAARPHLSCLDMVRWDQSFHMGPSRGWSDIGYNALVCPHGRAIEGRGLDLVGAHCPGHNATGYGVQLMVGGGERPSDVQMLRVLRLLADCEARSGRRLRRLGHRDGIATQCPGTPVYSWLEAGLPAPRGATTPVVEPVSTRPTYPAPAPVKTGALAVDGILGPATIRALQRVIGVTQDGVLGPVSRRALQRWLDVAQDGSVGPITTKALQRKVGATADGAWGPLTTKALQRWLNAHAAKPVRA